MKLEDKIDRILESIEQMTVILQQLNEKLDLITNKENQEVRPSLDIISILTDLDEAVIPTVKALFQLHEASAEQIAKITGRSRSRESQHLQKLHKLNYIEKIRKGREMVYRIKQ